MWLSIVIHLLLAGVVAWAGATAGRALAAPFWTGGLLGFAIYGLALAGNWLADHFGRGRTGPGLPPRRGSRSVSGEESVLLPTESKENTREKGVFMSSSRRERKELEKTIAGITTENLKSMVLRDRAKHIREVLAAAEKELKKRGVDVVAESLDAGDASHVGDLSSREKDEGQRGIVSGGVFLGD